MLVTLVVIRMRRRQGQTVLVPSLILAAVVIVGLITLLAYIQMILLLGLAILGLLLALRGNKARRKGSGHGHR
jgi:hypothetical protein